MPKISVVMSAYNHEPYVAACVKSVLAQEDVDFEFLVTDDGSTDGTVGVLQRFKDPRMTFIPGQGNIGAPAAYKRAFGQTKGEYIATISSDDIWVARKLKIQADYLDSHPECGAVFGLPKFIDLQGRELTSGPVSFTKENRSRQAWLRYFFTSGNGLCHPSVLVRRECYDQCGWYNNALRQLPDWDLWIRFCKRFDLHILDEYLLCFRLGKNTSDPSPSNNARTANETLLIMRTFFDGMTAEDVTLAFDGMMRHPDLLREEGGRADLALDIEASLLYLHPDGFMPRSVYPLIGLERLYGLLQSPSHAALLKDAYGIDCVRFHDLCGQYGVLSQSELSARQLLSALWRKIRRKIQRVFTSR